MGEGFWSNWKLNKQVNVTDFIVVVTAVVSVALVRSNDIAESRAADAALRSDMDKALERQTEILEEIKRLRVDQSSLQLDYTDHKARSEILLNREGDD